MWLKAAEPGNALKLAREIMRVLDDTGWLKRSMEQVLDLKAMIDEFKAAGYSAESSALAQDLNRKLDLLGLMLKPGPMR
jgi:hypothetical protein